MQLIKDSSTDCKPIQHDVQCLKFQGQGEAEEVQEAFGFKARA